MTQEKKQELTLKITQANKTQLITILYEMVIEYLNDAIDEIGIGKKADADKSLGYAQNCIDELLRSLDLNYELARNLHTLYIFFKKELMMAGISYSSNKIWRVEQNFKLLKDAYRELERYDTSAPMMMNTQKVYAGLTYGKYCLNEGMAMASANRGYMA